MFKFLAIAFLSFVALPLPAEAAAREPDAVTLSGYGPVKFGMTHAAAERALGVKLIDGNPDPDYPDCKFLTPEHGNTGISFMLLHGHIARVDVSDRTVATLSGARIEDSKESVISLYKHRLRITPHYYTAPDGSYLTLLSKDGKYGLRFETDMDKITTYYAGTKEAIQFVEGCL